METIGIVWPASLQFFAFFHYNFYEDQIIRIKIESFKVARSKKVDRAWAVQLVSRRAHHWERSSIKWAAYNTTTHISYGEEKMTFKYINA